MFLNGFNVRALRNEDGIAFRLVAIRREDLRVCQPADNGWRITRNGEINLSRIQRFNLWWTRGKRGPRDVIGEIIQLTCGGENFLRAGDLVADLQRDILCPGWRARHQ